MSNWAWYWITGYWCGTAAMVAAVVFMLGDFRSGRLGRLNRWLDERGVLSSGEHVAMDFANYSPLRNSGLTHKETVARLDEMWDDLRASSRSEVR